MAARIVHVVESNYASSQKQKVKYAMTKKSTHRAPRPSRAKKNVAEKLIETSADYMVASPEERKLREEFAVEAPAPQGWDVAETSVEDSAPVVETPAEAIEAAQPLPPVAKAPKVKLTWAETVAKRQAAVAAKGFKPGSNGAVLLPLMERPEGVTMSEARIACNKPHRTEVSLNTDLCDVAKFTGRVKVRFERDGQKAYRLLPVGETALPVEASQTEAAE
jgi:hypothetical protein